jgi:hypothetical protein
VFFSRAKIFREVAGCGEPIGMIFPEIDPTGPEAVLVGRDCVAVGVEGTAVFVTGPDEVGLAGFWAGLQATSASATQANTGIEVTFMVLSFKRKFPGFSISP